MAAPIRETLLLQALPVWLARRCNARFSTQMVCSIVPWTILHALEGIEAGVAAGLVSGFYYAFTYVHWRERSRWTAYWVTTVPHFIHNAIVLGLAVALDPSGAVLVAGNQNSHTMISYTVNPKTGILTPTGHKVDALSPVLLRFY